ncbi:cytochrome c biogenesis protein CcdA [Paenibacillus aurantius]|uniref:Cytochrome c biogenesis protein CcdA n=1 Tax=Paenibacillus aurantius TaxID=2918900 RepID=A0AA96RDH2_9BACL|nr:cytochrome c biogenesis protein CcdA [Paenibacillus aurantius]WJH34309.1 cytochrome c biogenesis protein CcdA [Paenibacillus sp. CC-CFT747]WNQ09416.1 cytochrome c biogenesis protein CcdA [Paenibacillus aurantius]
MEQVNIWIAFLAGIASFISPCCLPLYPSYLSYITGISVNQIKNGDNKKEVRLATLTHSLFFCLGFSVIFFSLSWAAGFVADFFKDNRNLIRELAALLILLMGLFMLGIFQPQFLIKERKLNMKWKPAGYLGSFLIGIGFAAGWSPCVGPILSAILALAATQPDAWLPLITAYSLGFAIPFMVLAFFIGSTKWILRYSSVMMKIGGAVMIVIAILLYTDRMTQITIWFNSHTPDWLKF